MSKILFLVNHDVAIYNFRLEIVERCLADGYDVHISSPYGERIDDLIALGATYHKCNMNRHSINPADEIRLLFHYKKLIGQLKPDVIFGFTIKPNIYGAIAAKKHNIPFIANITGLGTAVENPGLAQKITVLLYKFAFSKIYRVFFQNTENEHFFAERKIAPGVHELIPGSGVNLQRYSYCEYPDDRTIRFAFISRIMKEKGIEQYLKMAEVIKSKYPSVEFHVCGFCEKEYDGRLQELHNNGTVIYHGMVRNTAEFISNMHAIVHPTYYPEGISNILLESCAIGRPIITTDRSGCREVVVNEYNGYMIPVRNTEALISAIERFLTLNWEQKRIMGLNARTKVEQEFDRKIVVEKYMEQVSKIYGRV